MSDRLVFPSPAFHCLFPLSQWFKGKGQDPSLARRAHSATGAQNQNQGQGQGEGEEGGKGEPTTSTSSSSSSGMISARRGLTMLGNLRARLSGLIGQRGQGQGGRGEPEVMGGPEVRGEPEVDPTTTIDSVQNTGTVEVVGASPCRDAISCRSDDCGRHQLFSLQP